VCRVTDALDLELRLLASGDVEAARTLHESLSRWLLATASEARVVRDRSAAHLTVLRELFAMPSEFDGRVRRAIAIAARAGVFGQATPTLAGLRDREPNVARRQAELLRKHAPTLAGAFGAALERRPTPPRAPAGRAENSAPAKKGYGGIGFVVAGVLGLARF